MCRETYSLHQYLIIFNRVLVFIVKNDDNKNNNYKMKQNSFSTGISKIIYSFFLSSSKEIALEMFN